MEIETKDREETEEEEGDTEEEEEEAEEEQIPSLPRSVRYVYINNMLSVIAAISTQPVLLFYFNILGWTNHSPTEIWYYGLVNFLTPFTTLFLTPLLELWQKHRPAKELFLFDVVFSSYGYLIMALVDLNKWLWLFGYLLTRISASTNPAQVSYINRTTYPEQRQHALAMLPMFGLIGSIAGPLITIFCSFVPITVESSTIPISSSNLVFWVAALMSFARLPFLIWGFKEEHFLPVEEPVVQSTDPASPEETRRTWLWLAFLSLVFFATRFSIGIYILSFYPILVDHHNYRMMHVSLVLLVIMLLTTLPPLLMRFLQRRGWQDRVFLLIGLTGAFVPWILYALPIEGVWTVLIGGCLGIPMAVLVAPSILALFSKLVGPSNATPPRVALLLASQAIGGALGALFGDIAIHQYDTYAYSFWLIPFAAGILCLLPLWPKLATNAVRASQREQTMLREQRRKDLLTSGAFDSYGHQPFTELDVSLDNDSVRSGVWVFEEETKPRALNFPSTTHIINSETQALI